MTYPGVLTMLPMSPIWAILLFVVFFTVGLDTQVSSTGKSALTTV